MVILGIACRDNEQRSGSGESRGPAYGDDDGHVQNHEKDSQCGGSHQAHQLDARDIMHRLIGSNVFLGRASLVLHLREVVLGGRLLGRRSGLDDILVRDKSRVSDETRVGYDGRVRRVTGGRRRLACRCWMRHGERWEAALSDRGQGDQAETAAWHTSARLGFKGESHTATVTIHDAGSNQQKSGADCSQHKRRVRRAHSESEAQQGCVEARRRSEL